jgi:hypothetical protein
MPASPAGYVTELTFDGTDLQTADRTMICRITKGLNGAPQVRGRDTVIPHAAGRTARSRQADQLVVEVECWILADDPDTFRTRHRELMTLFDGVDSPRVLSCLLEDGGTATINARPIPPILETEPVPSHVARLDVQLESVDPYWVIVDGS